MALRSARKQVSDRDCERAVLVRDDVGDVLADRVLDFFAAAALEIFDVLPQHGGQSGDVDGAADVLGGRDGDFELGFLLFEVGNFHAQIVIVEAGQDGLEAVLDACVHAGELAALCRDILCALLLGEAGGDFLGERDEVRAAQQALLDGVDDERFERFTANRVALAAVALAADAVAIAAAVVEILAAMRAGDVREVVRAAARAMDEAGEQEDALLDGRAACAVLVLFHAFLDAQERLHVDDGRDSAGRDGRLARVVLPADVLAHDLVRVRVPCVDAGIAGVFQHVVKRVAGHRCAMAADDVRKVELVHDVVVAIAVGIEAKDLAHDGGFTLHDEIALILDAEAERRHAAEEKTLAGGCIHAVEGFLPRLEHHVLAEADGNELAQEGVRVKRVAELLMAGNDVDVQLAHEAAEGEPVRHVARAARNVVDDDVRELAAAGGLDHALEGRAVRVRAAASLIDKLVRELDVVLQAVAGDLVHLVLDAVLGLIVGAIAGIRRSSFFFHDDSS
ncbi:MAG: hypothetical protein MSA50_03940 [Veillonellaceae bacterium]|nr:hypothetical protein [Veillonellaceae bacterium]